MHDEFSEETLTQMCSESILYINTYTCKHKHKHPTHTHMPHAVSGFHVLCPDFWLVPKSKQGVPVYFLAASKYFTPNAFMLKSGECMGDVLLFSLVNNLQVCKEVQLRQFTYAASTYKDTYTYILHAHK